MDTALSVLDEFRIKKTRAREMIKEVSAAVSQWQKIAAQYGLSKREIERMACAFEHEEADKKGTCTSDASPFFSLCRIT